MKIHLDTDIGGDIDDLCALAMLLKWRDVELTGITTVTDDKGKRAGYAKHALAVAGRADVPVKAGADISGGNFRYQPAFPQDERYWPEPITPAPNAVDEALELLRTSIEQHAVIACIGQLTNLALLDRKFPGILRDAHLVLMGGMVFPVRAGYRPLANEDDYNIQLDVSAARAVLEHSAPTLVPVPVGLETWLRQQHVDTLKQSDRLAQLLARQAEAFAGDERFAEKFGTAYEHVPADIINFLYDPLACAIAAGYTQGVEVQLIPLRYEMQNGFLVERIDRAGKPTKVVTRIDGDAFSEFWLRRVAGS